MACTAIFVVALRKESVDRNKRIGIEPLTVDVALRKESVDRNNVAAGALQGVGMVALRKESVDRNKFLLGFEAAGDSRSPQGERG